MRGAGGGLAWDEYSNEAMYPDSSVRTRIETVEAAHGYRNTGEVGGALFRSGLLGYRFTNPERLTMPVLIIAGGRDGAARPEGLRELADRLSHATFLEYERSGHFLYVDDPDRFAADVIDFLTPPGGTGGDRPQAERRLTGACSSHAGSFEVPALVSGNGTDRNTRARMGVPLIHMA